MTWDETAGTIVTGAIGIGIGLAVAGKIIKDIGSIKTTDDGRDVELNKPWRL